VSVRADYVGRGRVVFVFSTRAGRVSCLSPYWRSQAR
jgi:hypothetical protein